MSDTKKYKIIIVDDDDFLLDMYVGKFNKEGVEVVACKSGKELLDKLQAKEVADLILLDIVLPEINGIEVLERIRKENFAPKIPIVMLTNQSEGDDMEHAKKLNIAGYIVKASNTPSEVVEQTLGIINKSNKK
ncbi:MAG: response regulator [Patescibacteria group bacterium]